MGKQFLVMLMMLLTVGAAWADKIPAKLLGRWEMVGAGTDAFVRYEGCEGGYIAFDRDGTYVEVIPDIDFFSKRKSQLGRRYEGKFSVKGSVMTFERSRPEKNRFSVTTKGRSQLLTLTGMPEFGAKLVYVFKRKL